MRVMGFMTARRMVERTKKTRMEMGMEMKHCEESRCDGIMGPDAPLRPAQQQHLPPLITTTTVLHLRHSYHPTGKALPGLPDYFHHTKRSQVPRLYARSTTSPAYHPYTRKSGLHMCTAHLS